MQFQTLLMVIQIPTNGVVKNHRQKGNITFSEGHWSKKVNTTFLKAKGGTTYM